MAKTITLKTKEKAKRKGPKDAQPTRTKERREREEVLLIFSLVARSYVTQSLSNVACMQILRFNNNKIFKISLFKRDAQLCHPKPL